jgi:hypothetical protein
MPRGAAVIRYEGARGVSWRVKYVDAVRPPGADVAQSKAGRRTIPLGPIAAEALEEQYRGSRHRADESIVFSHPSSARRSTRRS